MKTQTCCFTGHRDLPQRDHAAIQKRLESEITNLIHQGIRYFGAGGALGFDAMAAQAVLSLKEQHPQIKLILVLPCKNQTKDWPEKDIKIYDQILQQADKVVYVSENYDSDCMQKRNRHLVDGSAVCLCYLTETKSGTASTVDYAKQQGLRILNLHTNSPHT